MLLLWKVKQFILDPRLHAHRLDAFGFYCVSPQCFYSGISAVQEAIKLIKSKTFYEIVKKVIPS